MNTQPLKVLLIEDNPGHARLVERMLSQAEFASFDLAIVDRLEAGRDYLAQHVVDAILLDLFLPDSFGLNALAGIQAVAPTTATIVLTGIDNYQLGVESVNLGAQDFLVKGIEGEVLGRSIRYAVERMRSAQSLLESESKFRSVVEQSVDGIILVDEKGLIVEWNQAQEQICWIARDDAVGRPVWDVQYQLMPEPLRTPAYYEELKQAFVTFLETGQPPVLASEIKRSSGETRLIQASVSPIHTRRGVMASITIRDVTTQAHSLRAIEEAYLFLQYTLDAMSVHMAILDETGTIIKVNEAWRRFADANDLNDPTYGVGQNYLAICESATGAGSEVAREVAAGIREALADRRKDFYLEYPCHSPHVQRWFFVQLYHFDINGAQRVIVGHYDITERKSAEEALAAERNLLQTLVDHMPDRIYAKDRDGRYIFKNKYDAHQMGAVTPSEVIGKTDFDYYPPDLAARYEADDQLVIQFGESLINREEPIMASDGTQGWQLTTKVPLRNSENEVVGLVGVGRDITERKHIREQLDRLHAEIDSLYAVNKKLGQTLNLETIYSTIHAAITGSMSCDGLYISSYTPDDQLIRCVWAWGDGQRLDADQFPPIPLAEEGKGNQSYVIHTGEALYLPDYQARLNNSQTLYVVRSDGSIADRDSASEENNLPRSSLFIPLKLEKQVLGVIQVFSYQLDAYSDNDLRFLKGMASQAAAAVANALLFKQTQSEVLERERAEAALRELNDILEQRIAERTMELRESETRYRAIVEDQTELIVRARPDKSITFVNDAYCRFYDLSRDSCMGHNFEVTIHEDDLARWKQEFATLTFTSPPVTIEHRTLAGDGKIHWMQWTNRLITDESGEVVEIQGVGRDITRQKLSEEVLRQALTHEMEVNEMRSRFISIASHDLRTPLAIIQASMDLLSRYGDRLTEERKQDAYQEIYRAIQQMVSLLDDILIIGRVEAGKLELKPEPLNLKTFCQNLLTELKTALGTSHRLNLIVTGQCERVWIDPKLLRHILTNLVSNAIKYSPSGNPVEINLGCMHSQVLLSVEDRGIGIPIDDQNHLFETFFRASNVRDIAGNGLGLAIVRQSVELHGGSITFESRPGEGTAFFVIIPCIPLENSSDENDSCC